MQVVKLFFFFFFFYLIPYLLQKNIFKFTINLFEGHFINLIFVIVQATHLQEISKIPSVKTFEAYKQNKTILNLTLSHVPSSFRGTYVNQCIFLIVNAHFRN